MQQRLGEMEWWGALLYPLLVAGCNLLLLPGSVLTARAAGFSSASGGARFSCSRVMCWARRWPSASAECSAAPGWRGKFCAGINGRASTAALDPRRLEDHFPQPGQPAFPQQPAELFLRRHPHPLPHLHALGGAGPGPRHFSLCYLGTLAQLGIKLCRAKKPSAPARIFRLDRRAAFYRSSLPLPWGAVALRMLERGGNRRRCTVAQLQSARNPSPRGTFMRQVGKQGIGTTPARTR